MPETLTPPPASRRPPTSSPHRGGVPPGRPPARSRRVMYAGSTPASWSGLALALDGKAYATCNYCTHLDCLLSSGKLSTTAWAAPATAACSTSTRGEPIYPPATEPIAVYPVKEEDGEVYVGVSEATWSRAVRAAADRGGPEWDPTPVSAPVEPARGDRVEVLGGTAAVSASSPVISSTGARVLAEGGNAVDATLAMAAVGWMVLPGQCGIGGDAFAVVREPDGQVWTVCGSGFGPDGGEPAFYRSRGHEALPLTGALAVTVPGALAALRTVHARGATRSLEELWQTGDRSCARRHPVHGQDACRHRRAPGRAGPRPGHPRVLPAEGPAAGGRTAALPGRPGRDDASCRGGHRGLLRRRAGRTGPHVAGRGRSPVRR